MSRRRRSRTGYIFCQSLSRMIIQNPHVVFHRHLNMEPRASEAGLILQRSIACLPLTGAWSEWRPVCSCKEPVSPPQEEHSIGVEKEPFQDSGQLIRGPLFDRQV